MYDRVTKKKGPMPMEYEGIRGILHRKFGECLGFLVKKEQHPICLLINHSRVRKGDPRTKSLSPVTLPKMQ
jgi:hypothetical protein